MAYREKADVGRHALSVMAEANGARVKILDDLRLMIRDHYVAPDVTAKRIAELGAPQTAELLREHLLNRKRYDLEIWVKFSPPKLPSAI